MSRHPVFDVLLPLLLFPALAALAGKAMFDHLFGSGLQLKTDMQCPPGEAALGTTPYRISYTGYDEIDTFTCSLVAFFHAAMQPDSIEFLYYFFGTCGHLFLFPVIEGARKGQGYFNILVAYPVITGLIFQVIPVGIIFPAYWAFYIVGGHHKIFRQDAVITQAHAEAIMFGGFVGLAIPSASMVLMKDAHITAIWQPTPLWIFLAQRAHLLVRTPSSRPQSGYHLIKWIYLCLFMLASSTHLATLASKSDNWESLRAFLVPSVAPSKDASIGIQAQQFLQWDLASSLLSCCIGSLWFATRPAQVLTILLWNLVAVPLLSPSAAFLGVVIWRESKLNASRGSYGVQRQADNKGKKD